MPYFIPLGVPDFNGKKERDFFQFTYEIEDNDALELLIEIRDGSNVIYKEKITDCSKLIQGEHIWQWDGFDNHGILDTAKFTNAKSLNFYVTGKDDAGNYDRSKTDFKAEYDQVDWVDVKIDKVSKRIDVTLRVNLTDGGEKGTETNYKFEKISPGDYHNPKLSAPKKIYPWSKIPNKALEYYGETPIKTRTKSFEELKEMVLDGINIYWSRHQGNIGKNIQINNKKYEIFVNAINITDSNKSLDDIPLIYNTNSPWSRSGNTGGSYSDGNFDDEIMGILPNGLVQRISFNSGYIYHDNWKSWYKGHYIHKTKGWLFNSEVNETKDFEETSAHEIGHEILQAYAGTVYSWQHKGSSYYLPQDIKPVGEETFKEEYINIDYMENSKGENVPTSGEIDLMKYYNDYSDYKNRIIANEKDVLSLLWLTKLNLK